jgi:CO/xanthine dehydrogenase Mo-binding subunit
MDGEATSACTVVARKAVGRKIVTIEGLGRPGALHPIQRAFIETGAVQCGFCTPGMIISAKALLDKNPDPSHQDIVDALGDSICRCTGYKRIVLAIQSAALALRGGSSTVHGTGSVGDGRSHVFVGHALPARGAADKVTGRTRYTGDLRLAGMLHARMLTSPIAHARIKRIDTTRAESLPGVFAVATYKNCPAVRYNSALRFTGHKIPHDETIFPEVVRYVGDRVAAVAAEGPRTAAEALKLIDVEYEPLPAVFDPEEALKPDAPLVHERTNLVGEARADAGDVESAFLASDVVLEGRYTTPAVHHLAVEPHTCVADWDGAKLTVWTPGQNIFAFRLILSQVLGVPMNMVRVIKPPVGGAFGGKLEAVLEPVVAQLAMMTRRPVRMELTRQECMVSTRTRHAAVLYVKAGAKKDGTLTALDFRVITNTGAYATSATTVAGAMGGKAFMLYATPNIRFRGYPVYTNTPVAGAMRGYGSPQLFAALELHMDAMARNLGLDPVEFRLKNLVHPGGLHPATGKSLGNCRIRDCIERAAELIGWQSNALPRSSDAPRAGDALSNDAPRADAPGGSGRFVRAMGGACGLHGNGLYPLHTDQTTVTLKMCEDGTLVMFTGTQDLGQDALGALAQIAGEVLSIDPGSIEIVDADTELVSFDIGTYASRTIWVGGNAAKRAAEKLLAELKSEAARMMQLGQDDLAPERGSLVSKGNPSRRASYCEIATWTQLHGSRRPLLVTETYDSVANAGSYGAHFAEVVVDTETGKVQVSRYAAVHDVGVAINPLMVLGQIEGGVQMGLGYATSEQLLLDPSTGRVTNAHLKRYKVFRAADMPEIVAEIVDGDESAGPFGAKSIGEASTVPSAPAVINAINNALGTRLADLPATPQKILEAIKARSST